MNNNCTKLSNVARMALLAGATGAGMLAPSANADIYPSASSLMWRMLHGDRVITQSVPAVDLAETPKEYNIRAELPGLKKEDISITFENGVLSISGERKREKQADKENTQYHIIETSYGSFVRSFALPGANPNDIKAEFRDGVLDIRVGKSEEAKAKKITIN